MTLRAHPELPWLGAIPEHWRVERGRFVLRQETRAPDDDDGVVTAFRDGQVTLRENRRTEGFTIAIKETGYQGVRRGDLVIHSMDAFAGAIGVSESDGKCTGEYVVCNTFSGEFDNRYYARVLRQMALKGFIYVICPSVRERAPRFRFARLKDAYLPVPPPDAQKAIADFLDRKTAAIDALIEKKQKLLDLLAEKRAALINQAVTKGLDPNVPMKDSGIPWIGEIPAHWSAAPLYSRYDVQLGKMLNTSRVSGQFLAPYLRNANVQWDRIVLSDLKEMDFSAADRMKFALRPGDILMCEGGANAKVIGRSAVWEGQLAECYYQKALHRVRSFADGEVPRFLLFAFRAACDLGVFVADANANIFHLPAEKLRVLRFAFPPPEEQAEIVETVDAELRRSRATAAAVGAQIQRLREYRQALITAAVTGQLDVEAAA